MRMQSQLSDITQYKRNGTMATTKLSTEDVAISSLLEDLCSIRKLATATTAADPNDPTRKAALDAAYQLKSQIISLGNTRIGDQYIFGGDANTSPPFQADGTYIGSGTTQQAQINNGVSITVNHVGQPLFTDALTAVNDLLNQLANGTPTSIGQSAALVETATQTAQGMQSEVGSRLKDIQMQSSQLASQGASLLDRRDALMTVDPATALISLQTQQTALTQAYAVVGRVLQSTLTDYLK
jgi:flagellar hook-associated protein 3 FlgL